MKRSLLFIPFVIISHFLQAQTNPVSNPSFEEIHSAPFCDHPDDWTIRDAATGYTNWGLFCIESTNVTDGTYSLQIGGAGSGTGNKVAAVQSVDLSPADTLAFDIIGPSSGEPQNATVNVYVDGEQVAACGHVGNNRTKVCKVPVAKYAGVHEFEIRMEQRRGDQLGNAAIDNIRVYDPCEEVTAEPEFELHGADTANADLPYDYSITRDVSGAHATYRWFVNNKPVSLDASLTHVFATSGSQTIMVIADHCFGSGTLTKEVFVIAPFLSPMADFSASKTSMQTVDTVQFTDLTSNNPNQWEWEITPANTDASDLNYVFVNGTGPGSANPAVAFLRPGTYNVCLTASNRNGSQQECKDELITVESGITRNGDTLRLNNAHEVLWSEHGEHNSWTAFPEDTGRYRKVYMYYNLSCAPPNCNDWDYTTQVEVLKPTGRWDTLVTDAPNFRVDGEIRNEQAFSWDTTYNYYFNPATKSLDSVPHAPLRLTAYNDELRPLASTSETHVFPGDYYRYQYDTSGNRMDSTFIPADTLWQLEMDHITELEQETVPIEISRVSTPYAGSYPTSWSRSWKIDVTDYASIFKGAAQIRDYYRGNNSTGHFKINIGFEFIEGIPPRDNSDVQLIYNSPGTGFYYGYDNDPIEDHLVPVTKSLGANAESNKLRVWINGHGFGGKDNCAEFCKKEYVLKVNGSEEFSEVPWRTNCSRNALFPQGGTWIYSRTNWCPGSPVTPYDYEITPLVDAGDDVEIDMDFESFTFDHGGTPSRWVLTTQLLSFGEANFTHDAALEEIIAPYNNWYYNRENPACAQPKVRIQNTGSEPLTSLKIIHGVKGGEQRTYEWTGNLAFMETEVVTMPANDFGSWSGPDIYEVEVMEPNGETDEYAANNRLEATFDRVPESENELMIWLQTNKAPEENWYEIIDADGNVVYERHDFAPETLHRDTVNLPDGCYRFILHDDDNDGLSFFTFNDDGTGYAQLRNGLQTLKVMEPNFGSRISQAFTVGYSMYAEERKSAPSLQVYPNPAKEQLLVEWGNEAGKEAGVTIFNTSGQTVYRQSSAGSGQSIDVGNWSSGMYLVKVQLDDGQTLVKRFVKE